MKNLYVITIFLFSFQVFCFGQDKKLDIPINQWVKIGECPGDILEREVPPGRGSSWVYNSDNRLFYRFGGFTPRYSNALTTYNPATKAWTELWADDENYPETRPPGVAAPSMAYDAKTKKIWISGGFRSVESGKLGVWQYDVEADSFSFFKDFPARVSRMAYAFDRNIAVSSPAPQANYPRDAVFILDLKTGEWIRKSSPNTPHEVYRGNYPIVYHQVAQKMVVVTNFKDSIGTYVLDLDSYQWEKLDIQGPPGNNRTFYNLLYEPKSKLIFLFGGHNARDAAYYNDRSYYNDTWVLDLEKKEWREIKIPGPSTIKTRHHPKHEYDVLTFSHAYDFDAFNECIIFSDPDRGIWALKYDSTQSIAPDLKENESIPAEQRINFATMNFKTPPKEGLKSNESLRVLPSGLNEKLLSLADNTVISLGGRLIGHEIAWAFSAKHGVFFKYGGCGNSSAPFWAGYGNDLGYYDPVSETFYTRRVGDISGADRPGTGCTRSIVWDSKREVFWILGGSSAGPYTPSLPDRAPGTHVYDPLKDQIYRMPRIGNSANVNGHHTYLSYDENADIFVAPQAEGKTAHFVCAESRWEMVGDTNSPGALLNYSRTIYIGSKKKIFMIYPMRTGKVSEEKPEGWVDNKTAAGKSNTIWELDKKDNQYKEKTIGTFMYDATTKKWEKQETKNQPTYRESKYGLAYDPYNDIVFLVGGNIGWNGPVVSDMWAYHVQKNEWEKLNPDIGKAKISYNQCLMTDFDTRHNVLVFAVAVDASILAYRYKKGDWKPEK